MQIDQELLEDCIKCKRSAQNRLYKEVFSYLMNICIRYKNDYDSAGASLNAIFLKLLSNLEEIKKTDRFIGYMKRIAVNHLIDEYRKEKRTKNNTYYLEERESLNNYNQTFHESEADMDSEYLLEMIRNLPPITAQVFNLYAIDGYKHREIAEILEMSENTSKWHLREARIKLKKEIFIFNKSDAYGG